MASEPLGYGLHRGVPFDDYLRIPAISASSSKVYAETGSLLAVRECSTERATAAQRVGTLFHMFLLETERFKSRVTVGGPINPKTGNAYGRDTKAWAEWEAANPDAIVLTAQEVEAFRRMAERVAEHPIASKYLLTGGAVREATMLWRYTWREGDGTERSVDVRGRPDYLREDEPIIVDLKTTELSVSPRELERRYHKWGYHRQAAVYCHGYHAILGTRPRMIFVNVQTVAPFECVVVELTPRAVDQGLAEWHSFAEAWERSTRTGLWPGAGQAIDGDRLVAGIIPLDVPKYARMRGFAADADDGDIDF